MSTVPIESWDGGRLLINAAYADLLKANGLTTALSLLRVNTGSVVKHALQQRRTLQVTLQSNTGPVSCFLKYHGPAPFKEYLKPFSRLLKPIIGAGPEWSALLRFHELGIPTMTPLAYARLGRSSCLLTLAIEDCTKLSEWQARNLPLVRNNSPRTVWRIATQVAGIARKMHGAKLYHQDFYAGHLLVREDCSETVVIDLGRVQKWVWRGPFWVIKDLGQLHYSTPQFSRADRWRFLTAYLGRRPTRSDLPWIQKIQRKAADIARHSHKRRL